MFLEEIKALTEEETLVILGGEAMPEEEDLLQM